MLKHLAVTMSTFVIALGGVACFSAAPANADDAPVLVTDAKSVELVTDDEGVTTASVSLENQSGQEPGPALSVVPGGGAAAGCLVTVEPATLKEHRQQKVTVEFSASCEPDRKQGTNFVLTAGASTFELHATPPTEPDPDWDALVEAYLYAAAAVFLLLLLAWVRWRTSKIDEKIPTQPRKLLMSLHGLDADWKFSDSWASNATVVTALFTGIFGSKEVTKALLGDGTDDLLAMALVSAAVSVGLAGLSPMVLQASRKRWEAAQPSPEAAKQGTQDPQETVKLAGDIPPGLYVTPLSLLAAAFLTLTATVGQLATVGYALSKTEFSDAAPLIGFGVIASLLIAWYAVTATRQNLITGAALPPPVAEDESLIDFNLGHEWYRAGHMVTLTGGPFPPTGTETTLAIVAPPSSAGRRRPAAIL